ncbi:MAG: TetR/AcrR family transcriptional regulator [Dehalococcoidia bacterium]|jgi:AcrR family transcriptional regulator
MRKVRTFSSDTDLVNERRDHIVKIATELIIKKGYNNISTRELASALGMSTGGLYHYIGSKEDILYLIINFTSDLTRQSLSGFTEEQKGKSSEEKLRYSIKNYLEIVENYRDFHNFVNHIMLSLPVKDRKIVYKAESRVVDYYEKLIADGIAEGVFQVQDPRIAAHNIIVMANAWANRGWFLKKHYTLQEYTEEQTALILSQLKKSPKHNGHKPLRQVKQTA